MPLTNNEIAKLAHEANRALFRAFGDDSQPPWSDAPGWQKKSALNGVVFVRKNPNAPPSWSHENWLKEKKADGWTYGDVKDPDNKRHPCMVPFAELPPHQKAKDFLFLGIVKAALEIE